MASKPALLSRLLTRNKLAEVFKNHEIIKAFENLFQDVTATIPDAIQESSADADSVLTSQAFLPRVPTFPLSDKADADGVLAMQSFLPPAPFNQPRDDENESRILASQIFGG